jgi:hypothetical protein
MSFFVSKELEGKLDKKVISPSSIQDESNTGKLSEFYFLTDGEKYFFDISSLSLKNELIHIEAKINEFDPYFLITINREIKVYWGRKLLGSVLKDEIFIKKKKIHYKVKINVNKTKH